MYGSPFSYKHFVTELFLEKPDLSVNRGMGDVQMFSGMEVTFPFDDRNQHLQLTNFHDLLFPPIMHIQIARSWDPSSHVQTQVPFDHRAPSDDIAEDGVHPLSYISVGQAGNGLAARHVS